jgi:flagellar transcriptional activator FlhD
MTQDVLNDDIQEFNMAYLLLAQKMLNRDRDSARFRLKIDDDTADQLLALPARALMDVACSDHPICEMGFDFDQMKTLTDPPRETGLCNIHAAILQARHPLGTDAK